MNRCLNTSHISHRENKTPLLSQITENRLSAPQKTSLEEEEEEEQESIIMNKILALCIGLLIITLPFSSQEDKNKPTSPTSAMSEKPQSNAAGLGPLPTVLCLLLPAATLGFMHRRP
ncbi:hypothetical protein G5714_017041 [Onychostoma macrolepis]|uniref:Uncharacterized protein n=1 Tax=Onychostoma macrolepis TaxID=369639 RepID=A0A7J6C5D6_9TELE|nr:hypothetical protein G5714_017041 [Onychostoma macrolepis]